MDFCTTDSCEAYKHGRMTCSALAQNVQHVPQLFFASPAIYGHIWFSVKLRVKHEKQKNNFNLLVCCAIYNRFFTSCLHLRRSVAIFYVNEITSVFFTLQQREKKPSYSVCIIPCAISLVSFITKKVSWNYMENLLGIKKTMDKEN